MVRVSGRPLDTVVDHCFFVTYTASKAPHLTVPEEICEDYVTIGQNGYGRTINESQSD